MEKAVEKYRHAVAAYQFPKCEPIYYCNGIDSCGQIATLFRPGGPSREHHRDLAEFWASALFNYLEDQLADTQFEEIGDGADYRIISDEEAHQLTVGLSFPAEHIGVPAEPKECAKVIFPRGLKALIGTDANGFFAIFGDL